MGTHRPAWAPGTGPSTTSPTSAAQAGTGSAATAAADDLQLPLGAVSPLEELLDELLQPQLGAGLPRRRLLQELVNLHHLPGPGAVSLPQCLGLAAHPPSGGDPERQGETRAQLAAVSARGHVGTHRTHPGTLPHTAQRHTQKRKRTLRVIHAHPTNPALNTPPDTLLPTEILTGVLSHTQPSPPSRNTHGHTLRVHIAQQTAPHAHVHVLISRSFTGTQSEAQSYQHIQTHTQIGRAHV